MGYQGRDVEVVFLPDGQCLVGACDSIGAIGTKELDLVNVSNYIVGRFTTRVALLELISVGANPHMVTAAICNEPSPTGEEILEGIRDELKAARLPDIPTAISTEKNMPTSQTGLGISIFGSCQKAQLRIGIASPGDTVYCLGLPKVGPEVKDAEDPEMVNSSHIYQLFRTPGIGEVVPVGSMGVRGEIELLAANRNCAFRINDGGKIDLEKSGGPSSCSIFTCREGHSPPDIPLTPLCKVGELVTR